MHLTSVWRQTGAETAATGQQFANQLQFQLTEAGSTIFRKFNFHQRQAAAIGGRRNSKAPSDAKPERCAK